MSIVALQERVIAHLQLLVRNGELTERGLARRLKISQPHVHNVIQAKRLASPQLMDRILRELGLEAADFLDLDQLSERVARLAATARGSLLVPLLKGRVAARVAPPALNVYDDWLRLPRGVIAGVSHPAFAPFDPDDGVEALLRGSRMLLLDLDVSSTLEQSSPFWAVVQWNGGGFVRLVRIAESAVEVMGQPGLLSRSMPKRLDWSAGPQEIIHARALWAGEDLRRHSPLAQAGAFLEKPTSS